MTRVLVVGAGNGGLTAAALLAKAGLDVTVLEAHSYVGGCAGTFRRKRYRFDAGATLAGGFNKGEVMDMIAREVGIAHWRAEFSDPAMQVHLPSGESIARYGDERRWEERLKYFGDESLPFWQWQEKTADLLWDFASRSPPFPPQGVKEIKDLVSTTAAWFLSHLPQVINPHLIIDALQPISHHLKGQNTAMRQFIDGQLLISAQTLSRRSNSLFSASALDLPRRGVVHLEGGIGTIAVQLREAVSQHGGDILLKHPVKSIIPKTKGFKITTAKNDEFEADIVIGNLTPWNFRQLMNKSIKSFRKLPKQPKSGWGAFMVYVGLDRKYIPDDIEPHHQIISQGPMSEGNTIFISISPSWDESRAPEGKRAITISTHTNLTKWWELHRSDIEMYAKRKETYKNKMLNLATQVFPDIKQADLIEVGTPLTFNHFTRRHLGWVGGFPQKTLFETFAPRLDKNLWMVGDSIFPGQSTAAVSLGAMRVVRSIIQGLDT